MDALRLADRLRIGIYLLVLALCVSAPWQSSKLLELAFLSVILIAVIHFAVWLNSEESLSASPTTSSGNLISLTRLDSNMGLIFAVTSLVFWWLGDAATNGREAVSLASKMAVASVAFAVCPRMPSKKADR